MNPGVVSRTISFNGEVGTKFLLMIIDIGTTSSNQHKYYDWTTKSFEAGHNDKHNNLIVDMVSRTMAIDVIFPSGAGTYIIKAIGINGTKILEKNAYTAEISKLSTEAELTFTPISFSYSSKYTTQPTVTSSGSPDDTNIVSYDFTVTNASSDSHGFGLRPTEDIVISNKYWYTTMSEAFATNPRGDGEDSYSIHFAGTADISDIGVGSELIYHKGTTAPVTKAGSSLSGVVVRDIDTVNKIISFNQKVAFEDGETITLKAYGQENISKALGISLEISETALTKTKLTKTIRAGSSSTTINLNGTYGIAGGNHVIISGLGIDNSSANAVTSVSASSSAGSIVVQSAQSDLITGSTIAFKGCNQVVNLSGSITVNKYPTANKTIYLDLDKFITVGAAS